MTIRLRNALAIAAFAVAIPAAAQSDQHQHEGMGGMMGDHGMMGGQGMMGGEGMGGMMQGCREMMRGGGHGMLPGLPQGNEKLELQMHADMMKAMGDILAKYAARLPDHK